MDQSLHLSVQLLNVKKYSKLTNNVLKVTGKPKVMDNLKRSWKKSWDLKSSKNTNSVKTKAVYSGCKFHLPFKQKLLFSGKRDHFWHLAFFSHVVLNPALCLAGVGSDQFYHCSLSKDVFPLFCSLRYCGNDLVWCFFCRSWQKFIIPLVLLQNM